MGKSYKKNRRDFDEAVPDETIFVSLSDVYMSDSTWAKLLDRDHGQIEEMRLQFEGGEEMVRVVLRPRFGGGYNVEDGRHRVIAAKLADVGFIEAIIVGS
jgi:ParB-like nuclease domain.